MCVVWTSTFSQPGVHKTFSTKMSSFTCITCHVAFPTFDIQREHYKTDWHRYNLKRKVAEMPPVTLEDFHSGFSASQSLQEVENGEQSISCQHCKKQFSNRNSYENHLKSKKHQEIVKRPSKTNSTEKKKNARNLEVDQVRLPVPAALQSSSRMNRISTNSVEDEECMESDDGEWEDVDEDGDGVEDETVNVECCLFCSRRGSSLVENVEHMTRAHSFFIPDIEYLTDLDGLILYLSAKVNSGSMCLWCNEHGKSFGSTQAVQQHMTDKGHCKMLFEDDALAEYADYYNYAASYPDNGDNNVNPDEEVDSHVLDGDDYQLVLPSGATIGHRSLMRYYRQNIPPRRQGTGKSQRMVQHLLSQYRAIGYSTTSREMVARRARDVKYLQATKAKREMHQGMKNNKLHRCVRLQYKLM